MSDDIADAGDERASFLPTDRHRKSHLLIGWEDFDFGGRLGPEVEFESAGGRVIGNDHDAGLSAAEMQARHSDISPIDSLREKLSEILRSLGDYDEVPDEVAEQMLRAFNELGGFLAHHRRYGADTTAR